MSTCLDWQQITKLCFLHHSHHSPRTKFNVCHLVSQFENCNWIKGKSPGNNRFSNCAHWLFLTVLSFLIVCLFFFYRVAGKTDLLQVSAAIVSTKNPNCVLLFFFYVIEQYSCQCLPFTPTFDTLPKIHYCMRCEYQFWLCSRLYLFFFIILFYFFGNKNRWRSQARSICLPRPVLLSVAEGREGREKRKKWEHTLSSLKCHSQLFCPYLN